MDYTNLILVDVDDTLLEWRKNFIQWLYNEHHIIPKKEPNSFLAHKWLEVNPERALELVLSFNESDYFGLLEPLPYTDVILPRLADEGWKFIAITSCSDSSIVSEMRRENLKRHFGNIFEEVNCLSAYADKKTILSAYPKTWWIDDNPRWVLQGLEVGHKCIIIDHPHNKELNDPQVKRAENWNEIYDIIKAGD